jgi:hypothetical protein
MTKPYHLLISLLAISMLSGTALAQPLEDVSLAFQNNGVVATIQMTGPVQYLRHFPSSHGKTLEIYYDHVQSVAELQKPVLDPVTNKLVVPEPLGNQNVVQGKTPVENWVDNEVRKSPPSGLIPSFTVTTRDQKTQPKLVIEFSREAEYSVEAGKDKRSLLITIRPEKRPVSTGLLPLLPVVKALAEVPANAAPGVVAMGDYNKQAQALMMQGRDALNAKNGAAAVEAFNKLLLLPPNDYTQDGQEWIGVARERSQQADKARIEYELYLRLYPEGEGAAQVGQRLANLSGHDADKGIVEVAQKKQEARVIKFGSISSRYYFGKSIDVNSTQKFNGAPETITTSFTDTSMLISAVDASERYLSEDYDGRLVFRDVNTKNFLSNKPSMNRISSAYGEIKSRKSDAMLRVGRQSAYGGGVMGRFDGLIGSYGQAQSLRVNAAAGALADYSQGSKPKFVSVSVDRDAFSVYGINQTVDGILDRRAIGSEWRYFEDRRYVFAALDYDLNFKTLNAVQMMGSSPAPEELRGLPVGTVFNFMLDHRKAPSLSVRNALNGAAVGSVATLQQTMTTKQIMDLAKERTSTSNMAQLGFTFPFKSKWQAGGDVRLSNISGLAFSGQATDPVTGLPSVDPITGLATCSGVQTPQGCLATQKGRGTDVSATATITGSGIVRVGDIWSASASINTSSAANGQSLYAYNHQLLQRGWTLDSNVSMYRQTDQFGGKVTRFSPMVRGAYQFRQQLTFDLDGGVERTIYTGLSQTSKITRFFFSGGLRWDF